MNDILIKALFERANAGQMTVEQIPIPYQDIILSELSKESSESM